MHLKGWGIHEEDLEQSLLNYFETLSAEMRHSFAPLSILMESMSSGYDPHWLQVRKDRKMVGLLAFNVDTMIQKQTEKQVKVNLYHLTLTEEYASQDYESLVDMALEYIWKHMHCSTIKLSIYHYTDADGKIQVETKLRDLFKSKCFKWKTVTNDMKTGQRVQILECQNTKFKEQINPDTCVIYRQGLHKENLHTEPLTLSFSTLIAIGDQNAPSVSQN